MTGPIIGLCAESTDIEIHGSRIAAQVATLPYVKAVRKAGGVPVVLPITVDPDEAFALVDRMDGVLITGGIDVDPSAYGEEPVPEVEETQPDRDAFEFAVARRVVERNVPTLAICRGVQSLNVALGGRLMQHVDDHMHADRYNEDVHQVKVDPSSELASIVGCVDLGVNSLHYQVVAEAGERCVVVAHNTDGHIEAVEVDGADRVRGVQWHPEMLRHRPEQLALFQRLVADSANS